MFTTTQLWTVRTCSYPSLFQKVKHPPIPKPNHGSRSSLVVSSLISPHRREALKPLSIPELSSCWTLAKERGTHPESFLKYPWLIDEVAQKRHALCVLILTQNLGSSKWMGSSPSLFQPSYWPPHCWSTAGPCAVACCQYDFWQWCEMMGGQNTLSDSQMEWGIIFQHAVAGLLNPMRQSKHATDSMVHLWSSTKQRLLQQSSTYVHWYYFWNRLTIFLHCYTCLLLHLNVLPYCCDAATSAELFSSSSSVMVCHCRSRLSASG